MAAWANFYILTGTAAATLIGLMFIAVTFGSKLVTPETQGQARVFLSPIIYHFAHAFIIACVAVIPADGQVLIGATAIGTVILRFSAIPGQFNALKKHESHDIETSDWVQSLVLPVILYVFQMVSGVAALLGESWPQYGIALSVLGLLLLGVVYAWDMLVWMASKME